MKNKSVDQRGLARLAQKGDRFSITAFWFSLTMGVTLLLVVGITVRFLVSPMEPMVDGLPGIATVLALPNAILAGAYTWGKKIDRQG